MVVPAPAPPPKYTVEEYFALVDRGILEPDHKVELLEGVVVATAPEGSWHANGVRSTVEALRAAVGNRVCVDQRHCLVAGPMSVPAPDVTVLPGRLEDHLMRHPSTAHLVVEVADSSLVQDRLTKSAIYAAAGIPEYWIVARLGEHVQVSTQPIPSERRYGSVRLALRGQSIALAAFPDVRVAVNDLLPPSDASDD